MRRLISFLIGVVVAAVVAGLGVLVAQNGQSERFTFLGTTFQGGKGWLAAGATALGFVLAFLVLIPGRLASAWRGWWLGRRGQTLEDRLRVLREEHATLQGSHRRLLEEHQRVMQRVLTPVAAGREQDAAQLPRTGPIYPDGGGQRGAALERQVREGQGREQAAPLDRLRARITATRAALAAKLAGVRRTKARGDARGDAPSTPDQGSTPQGPGAATS